MVREEQRHSGFALLRRPIRAEFIVYPYVRFALGGVEFSHVFELVPVVSAGNVT